MNGNKQRTGNLARKHSIAAGVFKGLAAAALATCLWTGALAGPCEHSGSVLPPNAKVLGYSLDQMASVVANFSISGNDPAYYPHTPFQILYDQSSAGNNTFKVKQGTFVYVKFFFIDDSPPVIGNWPADKRSAADYIFGRDQLGAHDLQIVVDGRVYSLDDPGYIGGPVLTPSSPDGSTHLIQIGAFLSPLNKGTHHVSIRGSLDGTAFVDFVGGPYTAEISYTVIVK